MGREACREAVLPTSTATSVQSVIDARLNGSGLNASLATSTLGICSGDTCTGRPDTVTIGYPYSFVFLGPVIDLACGTVGCDGSAYSSITLSTTSIMRNE